ncbi:hypothetical protein BIV60_04705 [Bacillus sp. MUM 116]|nr:hypothetical protein BIV60_04705 [Bacillus sp. MUM 116]
MKVPAGFSEHKQDFLEVNKERLKILKYYQKNTKKEMTPALNQLYVKQELEKDSLINAFKKAAMKYKENEDGTIQYWDQNHSYVYGGQ